jgi:hypothetical protein
VFRANEFGPRGGSSSQLHISDDALSAFMKRATKKAIIFLPFWLIIIIERISRHSLFCFAPGHRDKRAPRDRFMHVISKADPCAPNEPRDAAKAVSFAFVPDALRAQCRNLVHTYHAMHGHACLPDMLWKSGLREFIDKHGNLRDALRKASTARSARTANALFAAIATEILSLEVLAREYANWSAILPAAKLLAAELLERGTPPSRTWLMAYYLYPPRFDSPAATIAPAPAPEPMASPGHDGLASDTMSFRDIMMACRAEELARRPMPAHGGRDISEH